MPGDYELRLCEARVGYKTMLARPIKITAVRRHREAPASVAAGASFEVKWTGPNNERDYITIGETTPGGRLYLDYKYTRDGSPMKITAPGKARRLRGALHPRRWATPSSRARTSRSARSPPR